MSDCGESVLPHKCRPWSPPAIEGLLDDHRALITRTVSRVYRSGTDLPDVVQEAAIAIARSMGRFRGECLPSTWVVAVAARVALKHASRRPPPAAASLPDGPGPEADPLAATLRREFAGCLERALDALTPDHRATVALFHVEGLSLQETAEALDVPVGTVKSRLHVARRELRRLMQPYLDGDSDE